MNKSKTVYLKLHTRYGTQEIAAGPVVLTNDHYHAMRKLLLKVPKVLLLLNLTMNIPEEISSYHT